MTDSAPEQVTLTFSEGVSLADDSIRVFDPEGRRVDAGEPKALGGGAARYGVELRPGLPDGTFTVAWQVVSTDSHPISGAFTFAVGAPSESTAEIPEQEAGGGLVGLLHDIARYASYGSFVVLTGGAAFVLVCWPRGTGVRALQRLVVRSWITLTAATLALLLLRTPYTGSGELADAFDLDGLRDVLETKTGGALLSRLLLLAAAALFVGVLFGTYGRRLAASGGGGEPDTKGNGNGNGDGDGDASREGERSGKNAPGSVRNAPDPGEDEPAPGRDGADAQDRAGPPGVREDRRDAAEAGQDVPEDRRAVSEDRQDVPEDRRDTAKERQDAAEDRLDGPGPLGGDGDRDGDGDGTDRRDLFRGLAIGGLVVSAGLAGTWAMSEHASTGIQPQLAMPVDVVHLLAVAAWLGGLTALLVALYRGPAVDREAVRRFSRIAFGSVIALVVTGLYQSWRQVGSWDPLVSTAYGRLLLAKIALVLLMVALARYSRRWTARLADGTAGAARADGAAGTGTAGAEAAGTGTAGTEAAGTEAAEAEAPAPAEATEAEAPAPAEAIKATVAPDATAHSPGPDGPGPADSASGGRVSEGSAPTGHTGPVDLTGPAGPAGPMSPADPIDPARAAQLARQRAALATARDKRARDADPERTGLRRSVLAEAAVAVLVLAVTTVLTGTEPARTEDSARAATGASATAPHRPVAVDIPFDTGGENGQGNAFLDVDPGFAGENTVHLRTEHKDGAPLGAPEVKLSFTLPDKDLGPIAVPLKRITPDHWIATEVRLPMAGTWKLSLTVRTSDIDQVTETRNVKIG
ncbi:copper resistance CopC/CopD family protein [Streptomyces lycii]